jgi:hypothetical protein
MASDDIKRGRRDRGGGGRSWNKKRKKRKKRKKIDALPDIFTAMTH